MQVGILVQFLFMANEWKYAIIDDKIIYKEIRASKYRGRFLGTKSAILEGVIIFFLSIVFYMFYIQTIYFQYINKYKTLI